MENQLSNPAKTKRAKKTKNDGSFVGDRLRLARSIAGLSQKDLAARVTVTPAFISMLEKSTDAPSEGLLLALCEALNVMPRFFSRPVADEYQIEECSFRHLQSTPRKIFDAALAKGTFMQEAVRQVAAEVILPNVNVPEFPIGETAEAEDAANRAREHWGLGLAAPIVNTIRVAENAGIVVTRLRGTSAKVDAFSRFGDPPLIVVASTKESASRDRFNVAHEIAHLIGHRGRPTGDLKTEQEANRFAAAFLLPRDTFAEEFRTLLRIDWPHLFELKRRWRVSGALILHRATELSLIDALTARRLYKQYSWKRWHQGEPYEPIREEPELFVSALEVAERDNGSTISTLIAGLGWRELFTEFVTGVKVLNQPDENVARLDQYRNKERR